MIGEDTPHSVELTLAHTITIVKLLASKMNTE